MANNTLINKKHVKDYILRRQKEMRPGWEFTQIAGSVYVELDAKIRLWIDRALQRHPSRTKTFKDIL